MGMNMGIFRKMRPMNVIYLGALLATSVVIGFNCSGFQPLEQAGTQNLSSSAPEASIPIALLTSEQILKTMLSATGTENAGAPTPADDLILSTYNERSGSLPSDQSITQASAPMLMSVTNLASAVCAKAVANDVAVAEASRDSRMFFREFDFSQGLSGQNSAAVVAAFNRLARNSWRRDTTSAEQTMISDFASDFSTGANMTDTNQTRLLATSVCTVVLSSIDALTY